MWEHKISYLNDSKFAQNSHSSPSPEWESHRRDRANWAPYHTGFSLWLRSTSSCHSTPAAPADCCRWRRARCSAWWTWWRPACQAFDPTSRARRDMECSSIPEVLADNFAGRGRFVLSDCVLGTTRDRQEADPQSPVGRPSRTLIPYRCWNWRSRAQRKCRERFPPSRKCEHRRRRSPRLCSCLGTSRFDCRSVHATILKSMLCKQLRNFNCNLNTHHHCSSPESKSLCLSPAATHPLAVPDNCISR